MTTRSQALYNLRKRGNTEIRRLETMFSHLTPEEKTGTTGERIRQQQAWIRDAQARTKTGRNPSAKTRLKAAEAANELRSMVAWGSVQNVRDEQERANRIFRTQMRKEEEGVESATYGGEAGRKHYERIFYMATQSIWKGGDPDSKGAANRDRDKMILDALGFSSLEEAYKYVLSQNQEAIDKMEEIFGDDFTAWKKGDSDPIIAYIENVISRSLDR